MTSVTFLGTGNYLAPGRYWNSFVIDRKILVEPSPSCLANLRKSGISAETIETVVISHFHADHTFGWPFLLLELASHGSGRTLSVVGPPGVENFLETMMQVGAVSEVHERAHERLDIRYTEVDCTWQKAGDLRFRAVEVVHVSYLQCFGYLFDCGERILGYSGDTQPCPGLDEIAAESHALVLECNSRHQKPTHMGIDAVRELRGRYPDVRLILTHVGDDVDESGIPLLRVADDFETFSDL
ncbi:MAG TPA: MBL fold metallo-hydrolase [Acidimicrobiales bacterium]|nr:MBL fold metallo-hydrolase [Acidimicrobiales bacterium]